MLYGAGNIGLRWLHRLGAEKVYAFADSSSDKIGTELEGRKVLSIDDLLPLKHEIKIFISTTSEYRVEISNMLSDRGLGECISKTPYLAEQNFWDLDTYFDKTTIFEGNNVVLHDTHISKSYIGYATYIGAKSEISNVKIGKYCSIGPETKIVRGQHPTHQFVSTHPAFYSPDNYDVLNPLVETKLFDEYRYADGDYSVVIGNDVWIGEDVKIMEGVTISDGTIVGSGATVVESTKPYMIVGGVPAKIIGERFSENEREFLMNLKWWDKPEEWIRRNSKYFNDVRSLMQAVL